jgi:acyl-CoA dehydrogenase
MLLNPTLPPYADLDAGSRKILTATIDFFENRGKERLKHDDHEAIWYADFLQFVKDQRAFATFLTPAALGSDPADRWDTHRICLMNEVLGFYGLPYWYTWQVSILGLGPLWMSDNEALRRRAARALDDGGIFAFGLSEKAHGADLYSTEMMLTPLGDGAYVADGGKYYIGNANGAALISTFGRDSETDEYVFFAVSPDSPHFNLVKNVVRSQSYVAEFGLSGYPISEADILSRGQAAWDAALNTVNVGKYNLGWGSIGICTHAFYEAVRHAANRHLYGRCVTDFPHIQALLTDAYVRLRAMKRFTERANDYMRSASAEDRRYLLYNPIVKMKVTTEGETVINALWDVIAAKGFEKDTYFESAAREIRALPKLEGTVHVNMALVVKFMKNFLFNPASYPEVPVRKDPADDAFLFAQGPTRGLSGIRFHDFRPIFAGSRLPNVAVFREQVAAFIDLLTQTPPAGGQEKDLDCLLHLGEIFTEVVYGQLILEAAAINGDPDVLVDGIFSTIVRDTAAAALKLHNLSRTTSDQASRCLRIIQRPADDAGWRRTVLADYVGPAADAYEMKP